MWLITFCSTFRSYFSCRLFWAYQRLRLCFIFHKDCKYKWVFFVFLFLAFSDFCLFYYCFSCLCACIHAVERFCAPSFGPFWWCDNVISCHHAVINASQGSWGCFISVCIPLALSNCLCFLYVYLVLCCACLCAFFFFFLVGISCQLPFGGGF